MSHLKSYIHLQSLTFKATLTNIPPPLRSYSRQKSPPSQKLHSPTIHDLRCYTHQKSPPQKLLSPMMPYPFTAIICSSYGTMSDFLAFGPMLAQFIFKVKDSHFKVSNKLQSGVSKSW